MTTITNTRLTNRQSWQNSTRTEKDEKTGHQLGCPVFIFQEESLLFRYHRYFSFIRPHCFEPPLLFLIVQ
jgi:hypothetical protein